MTARVTAGRQSGIDRGVTVFSVTSGPGRDVQTRRIGGSLSLKRMNNMTSPGQDLGVTLRDVSVT